MVAKEKVVFFVFFTKLFFLLYKVCHINFQMLQKTRIKRTDSFCPATVF